MTKNESLTQLHQIVDKQTRALEMYFVPHDNNDEGKHRQANLDLLEKKEHLLNFVHKRRSVDKYLDKRELQIITYQAEIYLVIDIQIAQLKIAE